MPRLANSSRKGAEGSRHGEHQRMLPPSFDFILTDWIAIPQLTVQVPSSSATLDEQRPKLVQNGKKKKDKNSKNTSNIGRCCKQVIEDLKRYTEENDDFSNSIQNFDQYVLSSQKEQNSI